MTASAASVTPTRVAIPRDWGPATSEGGGSAT